MANQIIRYRLDPGRLTFGMVDNYVVTAPEKEAGRSRWLGVSARIKFPEDAEDGGHVARIPVVKVKLASCPPMTGNCMPATMRHRCQGDSTSATRDNKMPCPATSRPPKRMISICRFSGSSLGEWLGVQATARRRRSVSTTAVVPLSTTEGCLGFLRHDDCQTYTAVYVRKIAKTDQWIPLGFPKEHHH